MKTIVAKFRAGDRKTSLLTFRLKVLCGDLKLPDCSIEVQDNGERQPSLTEVAAVLAQAAYTLHQLAGSGPEWKRGGHALQASRAVDNLLKKCKKHV